LTTNSIDHECTPNRAGVESLEDEISTRAVVTKQTMEPEELRRILNGNLAGIYKNSEEGQILYSGIDTLQEGKFYILGFNPRPDPSNRELKELSNEILPTLENWSAYTCQCWHKKHTHHKTGKFLHCKFEAHRHDEKSNRACECAGADDLQLNVVEIMDNLGLSPRKVFASNVLFVQTEDVNEVMQRNLHETPLDACWNVHREFLRVVKPRFILCLGYEEARFRSAFRIVRDKAHATWGHDQSNCCWPNRNLHFKWFEAEFKVGSNQESHLTTVIGIRHPRYVGYPCGLREFVENHRLLKK
jgi:hypothetical protein